MEGMRLQTGTLLVLVLLSLVSASTGFAIPSAVTPRLSLHALSSPPLPLSTCSSFRAARARLGRVGAVHLAASAASAEQLLLDTLGSTKGRGQSASKEQLEAIGTALDELEKDGGIADPILSPSILGGWELIYTSKSRFDITNPLGSRVDGSKPGIEGLFRIFDAPTGGVEASSVASSSPIQRTVTSLDSILITQDIDLTEGQKRVDQRVQIYQDSAYLRLSAEASVSPQESTTKINFTFDLAYFQLGPIRIPYPVPFRLLGKEAMGWLDTTYLSDTLRISRGNKGTTFVLVRPGVMNK